MRIGIFGGAFNPPHNGHKTIGIELLNKYVDKVIYVPVGDKYHKDNLINNNDRYNMLKLMIKDIPNLNVSNYEFNNELIKTYQTLDHFKILYPNDEIYFVCGSDNINEIETWKNYKYILSNYKILVINRCPITFNYKQYSNIIITDINVGDISSTKIRKQLQNKCKTMYLDNNVINYIYQNNLYK